MKFNARRARPPGRRHLPAFRCAITFRDAAMAPSPASDLSATGTGLDLCEAEQSALARRYVLTADLDTDEPWSHAGPRSVSPFAPCAASRLAHVFAAARLDERSVLWDLGCGDGRVLLEACARYGCRCVGVEIDAECLERCERSAEAMGPEVASRCSWHLADMTAMPPGALGAPSAEAFGKRAADARENAPADTAARALAPSSPPPPPPPPTTVLIFITGRGLCEISGWLKREWTGAPAPFAVVTCVESLDACVDYTQGLNFTDDGDSNPHRWDVYRDPVHARYGVFLVPPRGVTLNRWRAAATPRGRATRPSPTPSRARSCAAPWTRRTCKRSKTWRENSWGRIMMMPLATVVSPGTSPGIRASVFPGTTDFPRGDDGDDEALATGLARAVLGDIDGDGDANAVWSAAEDAAHASRSHRVAHLHASDDAIGRRCPRQRAKLLRAMFAADANGVDSEGSKSVRSRFERGDDASETEPSSSFRGFDVSGGGWGILVGRSITPRSIEYHAYGAGGAVDAETHRDTGSALTMSVLLEKPTEGGDLVCVMENGRLATFETLRRGDAVVFPSEKRHGVTPRGEGAVGRRRSIVVELWEGGVTKKNRHE